MDNSHDISQSQMNTDFALNTNPFFVLNSTLEDNIETLTEHYDDAVYDDLHDELVLSKAYQSITASLPRLKAEIRWLPGVDHPTIQQIIEHNTLPILDSFPLLTQINIIAHFFPLIDNETLLSAWGEGWESLSEKDMLEQLNQYRTKSGFTQISLSQLSSDLEELRKEHIQVLIGNEHDFRRHLDWLIAQLKKDEDKPLSSSSILMMLVEQGLSVMQVRHQQIKDNITSLLGGLFDKESAHYGKVDEVSVIAQVTELLNEWDQSYIPLSICNKRRGSDNYNEIFEILLVVANNVEFCQDDTSTDVEKMQLSMRIMQLGTNLISLKDTGLANTYTNEIIAQSQRTLYQTILHNQLPDFDQLIDNIMDDRVAFFAQVSVGKFSPQEFPNSLANRLYHLTNKYLASSQDEICREAIYSKLEQLFICSDLYQEHGQEIALYIHTLREIGDAFPMLNSNKMESFRALCVEGQAYIIQQYINYYLQQERWEEAYDVLIYVENRFPYNELLRSAVKEAKKPIAYNMRVTRKNENHVELQVLGMVIVMIIAIIIMFS